ncbi:hypothetical protein [Bacillus toyonensis]|uniref:hypothetical protein n=1 Tax=Bacillus toyonensis TaxID=155322 RepID=UPI000BFDC101|nr:hypothetical protein [Bacillus toyonensis]PHD33538.1 hypothetical protein COF48_17185 [Bacillus toyonensis]
MIQQEAYENRIVAFLDMLGFQEHITKTTQDPEHFNKIRNALNFIAQEKAQNDTGLLNMRELGREYSIFSDSIVISYPANYPGAAFYLLLDIIHIQLDMLSAGIVMRGAVTIGELCHNDNIVFGPAMVKAYIMESKEAVVPRVLVDSEVIKHAINNPAPSNSPKEELLYLDDLVSMEQILDIDKETKIYIDFLSQYEQVDSINLYLDLLEKLRAVIIDGILQYEQDSRVLDKYDWLKNYYNNVVKNLKPEYQPNLIP